MWRSLLRESGWSELLDFVSPSFFDVLPRRALMSRGRTLARNWRDRDGFAEARDTRATTVKEAGIPIEPRETLPDGERGDVGARGPALLTLYFHQLERSGPALLDLRYDRVAWSGEAFAWAPARLWYAWEPDFQEAMRDVYAGFYRGEDERFRKALSALHVDCAEDTFRAQFGEGDQTAVEFQVPAFRRTFHEAFVKCRDAGRELHPDFVPLGIYLALLYEHLETLGGTHDVRGAWQAVAG